MAYGHNRPFFLHIFHILTQNFPQNIFFTLKFTNLNKRPYETVIL
jgi:hypothetical protein